ncbi:unnamed protein product [Rotaria sp. Silwood2]|nr:unnamed protein product [Rotaria sp. Silwood2]CAF4419565.1 unnamed protein product [Rotaria sp. Silwood2]
MSGKCATPMLPNATHQYSSLRCINCSKLLNYSLDINHDAFNHHGVAMLSFEKMFEAKLVKQDIISSHIYASKELQHRSRQFRECLQLITPISSPPILSTTACQAT